MGATGFGYGSLSLAGPVALNADWTLPEVARAAGVEYRTLHTWLQRGLFTPSVHVGNGTGDASRFTDQDVERVRWLVRLRRVGLSLDGLARAVYAPALIIEALESGPQAPASRSEHGDGMGTE